LADEFSLILTDHKAISQVLDLWPWLW